jgi:hypothetical protein
MNHEFQSATVKRKFGRVFLGGAQVDFSFRPTAEKAITYHLITCKEYQGAEPLDIDCFDRWIEAGKPGTGAICEHPPKPESLSCSIHLLLSFTV